MSSSRDKAVIAFCIRSKSVDEVAEAYSLSYDRARKMLRRFESAGLLTSRSLPREPGERGHLRRAYSATARGEAVLL